jgi:16S rRNA processing protein RimM
MWLIPDQMPPEKERPAGSLKSGEPAFVAVGKVRRPHGVRGDVLVELYTDFPERLKPKKVLFAGENRERLIIRSRRLHNQGLLLGFETYDTPEAVGRFRNQTLFVPVSDSPELPDGEYYFHDLLGLTVFDEAGGLLGELTEVMETGANDVYVVTAPSGTEILLPAIPDVILAVDLEARRMSVHLLPGLLGDGGEP